MMIWCICVEVLDSFDMLCSCCWLHIYVAAFCHPSSSPHHQYTLPIHLFSAALLQGAWSNRSAMSSPSWSPERSDAWDSPKTRPMHGLPIWTMRLVNEGRVLKGLGSAGDWAFKLGVGYNASAGLVWNLNSKMVQELWVKNEWVWLWLVLLKKVCLFLV